MKQNIRLIGFLSLLAFLPMDGIAQIFNGKQTFNRQDTLRGTITPERAWWDLNFYHLDISVDIENRTLKGSNTIAYKVISPEKIMQIDLQPPMEITKVTQEGKSIEYKRDGNAFFIHTLPLKKGANGEIVVFFEGEPTESVNPPWTGGLTWREDDKGQTFMANSNQGDGASMWWPCKDHGYDEPDSMLISVNVPDHLMDVSNGKLRKVEANNDGTKTFHWFVANPINNYGVNLSVADYAHFGETYEGEKGILDCNYYVLPDNLDRAVKQFMQVPLMLEAFEYWFGPYPFYEDGFKLIEVPYLGMEHQSAVTYGNNYMNGYKGFDRSDSGWGLKFDFIIIHESGHEWFANNITNKDEADMWIHEAFTAYSESLYLEYHYGKEAGDAYNVGKRFRILNDKPIIGPYNVNKTGSSDMYVKGANMLHTLRQMTTDEKWRGMLRGLNKNFYHQTVTTKQVEDYMAKYLDLELGSFFDQYLRDIRVPIFEYRIKGNELLYRWGNCVLNFKMPIEVKINGKSKKLHGEFYWQSLTLSEPFDRLEVDQNYYVGQMSHGVYESK